MKESKTSVRRQKPPNWLKAYQQRGYTPCDVLLTAAFVTAVIWALLWQRPLRFGENRQTRTPQRQPRAQFTLVRSPPDVTQPFPWEEGRAARLRARRLGLDKHAGARGENVQGDDNRKCELRCVYVQMEKFNNQLWWQVKPVPGASARSNRSFLIVRFL